MREIRDVVLPIVTVDLCASEKRLKYTAFLGTGFLIGPPCFIVTAQHVLRGAKNVIAMRVVDSKWHPVQLGGFRFHPTEDVAVGSVNADFREDTFLRISTQSCFSSSAYDLWGYPSDLLTDAGEMSPDGRVLQSPDLIFNRGYIRRRVSHKMPQLIGSSFYELNEVAGAGCSGAPIIGSVGKIWAVIGLYVGERTIEIGGSSMRQMAYALRFDAIEDWFTEIGLRNLMIE